MLKSIHSFLQFLGRQAWNIIIWIWIVWVTIGQIQLVDIEERLDRIEKINREILEPVLKQMEPSGKLKNDSTESDTIHNRPYGNSDGWKGLEGLNI